MASSGAYTLSRVLGMLCELTVNGPSRLRYNEGKVREHRLETDFAAMKTKKIYINWKTISWKAHLKAALPGIAILAIAAGYFIAEGEIEKSRDRDPNLPILEGADTAEAEAPLDAGANIDPDNPPPLAPGPERRKFDESEKAEIAQRKDMSLQELRALSPDKHEKAVQEKVDARFRDDQTPAGIAKDHDFLRSIAATSLENAVYLSGSANLKPANGETSVHFQFSVSPVLTDVAEDGSDVIAPNAYRMNLVTLVLENGRRMNDVSGLHYDEGGGIHTDAAGRRFILDDVALEEGEPTYDVVAVEVPGPGATSSVVEALRHDNGNWVQGTIQWKKITAAEYRQENLLRLVK